MHFPGALLHHKMHKLYAGRGVKERESDRVRERGRAHKAYKMFWPFEFFVNSRSDTHFIQLFKDNLIIQLLFYLFPSLSLSLSHSLSLSVSQPALPPGPAWSHCFPCLWQQAVAAGGVNEMHTELHCKSFSISLQETPPSTPLQAPHYAALR